MESNKDQIKSKQAFGMISQNIIRNPYITGGAKLLYSYLSSFAGSNGSAFPGRELVCYELGLNKDTFSKYRWELECWRVIEIEQIISQSGKFEHNVYLLDHYPDFVMMPKKDFKEKVWPDLEKLVKSKYKKKEKKKDNNTEDLASTPCPEKTDTAKNDLPYQETSDTVESDPVGPDTVNSDNNNNSLNNNNFKNNKNNNQEPLPGCGCDFNQEEKNQKELYDQDRDKTISHDENHNGLSFQEIRKLFMSDGGINVWKPDVLGILAGYDIDQLCKIAITLEEKKRLGIIDNPSAVLASHPESVCKDILNDTFYVKNGIKKNKYLGSEYAFFAPME